VKPRFAAARLLAVFRKRRLDQELEGEILAHLEMADSTPWPPGCRPKRLAARPAAVLEESNR
jgi:hypothetical protein